LASAGRSAWGVLRAHQLLSAGLAYGLVAVVLFAPALLPGKTLSMSDQFRLTEPWRSADPPPFSRAANPATENSDVPINIEPLRRHAIERLPGAPLWNPHIMNGRPLLANAQSSVFSPLSLPAYVLPELSALPWLAILKLWVASFGTFLLARTLGMSFAGAFLAGLVYGFSLLMITWVTFPAGAVWAWIPWMLFVTDRLVRRPDLVTASAVAVVTGAQFLAGHPESSFHAVLFTVLFFTFRLWQRARTEDRLRVARPLWLMTAGLGAGGLLAGIMVFPFVELLWHSADLADRQGQGIDSHIGTRYALAVFLPDYWGRATATLVEPFQLTRAFYVGALPLMLAGVALYIRRVERLAFAIAASVSLAVVVGVPGITQVVTRLPVFSSGHNRFTMIWVLGVALLAGWGLDDLLRRGVSGVRRRRVLVVGLVLLALPCVVALARGLSLEPLGSAARIASRLDKPPYPIERFPEAAQQIRLASVLSWLVVASLAVLLLALVTRGRVNRRMFAFLAIALTIADLFAAGMGYNPAVARSKLELPQSGAIDVLKRHRDTRFVSQTLSVPENIIPLRNDLLEARGYDLPLIKRYDRLWRSQIEPECPTQASGVLGVYCLRLALNTVTPKALHTLRLLSVRYLLQPVTQPPLSLDGVRAVYEGRDGRVYEIVGALPRAWVVGAQRVVPDDDAALAAITSPDFDARRTAVTEEQVDDMPVTGPRTPTSGSAVVTRDEPERVTLSTTSSRPGLLVLSDTWFPGWKATLDGSDVPLHRVDYVMRGVPLPAGRHTVEFRYEPLSWTIGRLSSLLGLIAVLGALVLGLRRRRSNRATVEPAIVAPTVADEIATVRGDRA
jgi:hypothetical protein